MKFFKLAAAAALVAASLSASAMTTIADDELSTVAGQDGVSIGANLNINIGSFTYTNTTQNASVSFNSISITGLVAMTIDVVSNATFKNDISGAGAAAATAAGASATVAAATGAALLATVTGSSALGLNGSDVVQFAFPQLDTATSNGVAHSFSPSITVGSIKMSNSDASFGSIAIKNMDLQGTTVWMWAH